MALSPGDRLGSYEIVGLLGAGGMGEVYRARDGRLQRDVAIKVLPASLSADPERLARFEREAQVLASLNHPHISHVYGIEERDSVRGLVMELVEGVTLQQLIASGPIPIAEGLDIARQIADALDSAHERGIVHRDLKPANIKLTPEGTVKVLDFGLAKALHGAGAAGQSADSLLNSPTMTSPVMTMGGVILGTAAYMSPEQACGKPVDKRADVWAFGVVLYELLTRRHPFARQTVQETIAEVLTGRIDLDALPAPTPRHVVRLLQRCLERDPRKRLRDIGDAIADLEAPYTGSDPVVEPIARPRLARPVPMIFAGVALGVAATLGIVAARRPVGPSTLPAWGNDVTILSLQLPQGTRAAPSPPALSRDGRQIAWVAGGSAGPNRLWVESLANGEPRELIGTEGATNPFWSPDGRSIAFMTGGWLKRIEVSSATVKSIAAIPEVSSGGTWNQDGTIAFAARYGIFAVPASGGTPRQVAALNREQQENSLRFPRFLPDGKHFLYVARSGIAGKSGAYVGSLDGHSQRLFSATSFVRYAPPGHLLFAQEGALVARRFDPVTFALGSETYTIADRVGENPGGMNGSFDVSDGGVLAFYAEPRTSDVVRLQWVDRSGRPLAPLAAPGAYSWFRIAPDGSDRVVADLADRRTASRSVWVLDAKGTPPNRLTFAGVDEWIPIWSPDASRVAFMSYRNGPGDLYAKSLTGSAPDQALLLSEEQKAPSDWSPDGRFIVYASDRADTRQDVWVLPVAAPSTPIPIARTALTERRPRFSPDGHFIAYESDESGQLEVYVQPFPPTGRKWQVSVDGGTDAVWTPKELIFVDRSSNLIAVPVRTTTDDFVAAGGVKLFMLSRRPGAFGRYDSRDGQRFVVRVEEDPPTGPITMMLNWEARLKR